MTLLNIIFILRLPSFAEIFYFTVTFSMAFSEKLDTN